MHEKKLSFFIDGVAWLARAAAAWAIVAASELEDHMRRGGSLHSLLRMRIARRLSPLFAAALLGTSGVGLGFSTQAVAQYGSYAQDDAQMAANSSDQLNQTMDQYAAAHDTPDTGTITEISRGDGMKIESGCVVWFHLRIAVRKACFTAEGSLICDKLTLQGVALQHIPPVGGKTYFSVVSWSTDANGESYISHLEVGYKGGGQAGNYDFSPNGAPKRGETWDHDGHRTGVFGTADAPNDTTPLTDPCPPPMTAVVQVNDAVTNAAITNATVTVLKDTGPPQVATTDAAGKAQVTAAAGDKVVVQAPNSEKVARDVTAKTPPPSEVKLPPKPPKTVDGEPAEPRSGQDGPIAGRFITSSGAWGQKFADQWWLRAINWLRADNTSVLPARGQPVIVAVVDTGVDFSHPDLAGTAWHPADAKSRDRFGWNFVDNNADTRDNNGHGTVVAGIIAARPHDGDGLVGINPRASIMAVKVTDYNNRGDSATLASGIRYATDHGARVINVSIGGKVLTRHEQAALDYAAGKGALVVVAAGNGGIDIADFSPAGLKNVIAVAAIGPDNKRAAFSNWGGNISLAAPGADILSLRALNTDLMLYEDRSYKPGSAFVGAGYYHVSGTSFAAPIVSGAAALLFSFNPSLTAEQVKRMLLNSARDIDGIGVDQFVGYGLLDVAAAIAADPAYFIDASIAGVSIAQDGGKSVVRVTGTASADRLKEAFVEIGQGDAPVSWKRMSRTIQVSITNGTLDDLDPGVFAGAKDWTLRVIAIHQNGRQRESRYKLKLG